jgi:hypothetical protein
MVLSQIRNFQLEEQSIVYVEGTAQSSSDSLIEILEHGLQLHVIAHSHPGTGKTATNPSSIDIAYMKRIQDSGADVVGVIVTRDRHVRFFSAEKEFEVYVQGNGVNEVEKNVFQIDLPNADSGPSGTS